MIQKKYLLLLLTVCISAGVQAQVELNNLQFGIEVGKAESSVEFPGDNSFKNSLSADVDVYVFKKRLWWRNKIGAFRGNNGNASSKLPVGARQDISNFKVGDYLVFSIPHEALIKDGNYNGAKIRFGHTVVTEQTTIEIYDDVVDIIFKITEVYDDRKAHVIGHLCEPNDPECKPDTP